MSGYLLRVIDLDTIFEPLAPGDARYLLDTGFYSETGVDAKDKYAQLAIGDRYFENVGHVRLNTDLRDIFAALGSVPRFQPLPWLDNTGPIVTPKIYRQPSRELLTKVDLACRVLADGRCEITAESPNIHSNPNARKTDVLYSLSQPPLWNDSKVPAGVDFEISYELVSGTGWSLDGGYSFGEWVRLIPGHSGTTLRGQLIYNHATQAEGSITSFPKVRIHLRRTDYPNTNKTSGVITANLTLTVNASLFSPVSNWAKPIAISNTTATNYHNPDANTGSFSANTKAEFNLDGTLNFYTQNQGAAWVLVLSTRWRRADAETDATDYDVLCEVVSQSGGGSLGNPVAAWTQVTTGFVISLNHAVTNNTAPGSYTAARTLRLSIRQRSTRGYRESGVVLPDNFVQGEFSLSDTVVIKPPLPLVWPSIAGWSGQFSETKIAELDPGNSVALSEAIRLTFDAGGSVIVNSSQRQMGSGTWLPAGSNPAQIEMRSVMQASGTGGSHATGSEWNQLPTSWISFSAGTKVLQSSISITPDVGSAYRQYTGVVEMRRKSYPSDVVSIPLTLWSQVEFGAPAKFAWPATNWAGTHVAKNTAPFTPEAPNSISETIGVYFSANGNVTINRSLHGAGDNTQLGAGKWLPNGVSASEVEILVAGTFSGSAGVDTNQLSAWTQVTSAMKYMSVQITRNSAVSGLGISERNFAGTISLRRKAYPSDIITFAIDFTPLAEIVTPVAPSWAGMVLPDLIYAVSKNLNTQQPQRFETAKVSYVMGFSGSTSGKNVEGHHIYDTQLSNTPDGVDSDVVAINTRITPDGWKPSDFEWSFRVISGQIDSITPGVWRGMSNASYSVQMSVSANHGMGEGVYKRTAVVAIDVRRIAYPSQAHTFTFTMDTTITLVQDGPVWGTIVIPDQTASAESLVGLTYPANVVVANSGFVIGDPAPTTTNFHFAGYIQAVNWDGQDINTNPIGRLIPSGWNPNDFEWKYDVVSMEAGGTFLGDVVGGATKLAVAGNWNAFNIKTSLAYSSPRSIVVSAPTVQQNKAVINISIRHKTKSSWGYTYQGVQLINKLNWITPSLSLWPRDEYQGWAGTYYHTTEVEVKPQYADWIDTFYGVTSGQTATWKYEISSAGDWTWSGNGSQTPKSGRYVPPGDMPGGYYSIRATGVTSYGASTNITSSWQKIGPILGAAFKYVTLSVNRPPAGEVDNTARWSGTIEIRDDITGEITSGKVILDVTSLR